MNPNLYKPNRHRRANGQGTITRHPSGLWHARLSLALDETTGRRVRKSFYGHTEKDVLRQLSEAQVKIDKNLPLGPRDKRLTLATWMNSWLQNLRGSIGDLTHEQYSQYARLHILPVLGAHRLMSLTPSYVRTWLKTLEQRGLKAPRSRQLCLFILRHCLAQAVIDEIIPRNVASPEFVAGPKTDKHRATHYLRPEEIPRFEAALKDSRFGLPCLICVRRGLRRGEVLALQWADVDWERKTIQVQRGLNRVKDADGHGHLVLRAPKTPSAVRPIPIDDELVAALKDHRRKQAEQRLAAGKEWKNLGLIFTVANGGPIDPRRLVKAVKTFYRQSDIPTEGHSVHTLRHTVGSLGIKAIADVHPRSIQRLLGHSRIETTMNLYSHVDDSDVLNATKNIDAIIAREK